MTPRRIQMTRARPWRDRHPDAVIVDRRTQWGNPFHIGSGRGIEINGATLIEYVKTKADAARFFADLVSYQTRPYHTDAAIRAALRGRDLACWCRLCDRHKDGLPLGEDCPDCEPCHADILLRVSNEGEKE